MLRVSAIYLDKVHVAAFHQRLYQPQALSIDNPNRAAIYSAELTLTERQYGLGHASRTSLTSVLKAYAVSLAIRRSHPSVDFYESWGTEQ